jgi:hypothetical protein
MAMGGKSYPWGDEQIALAGIVLLSGVVRSLDHECAPIPLWEWSPLWPAGPQPN